MRVLALGQLRHVAVGGCHVVDALAPRVFDDMGVSLGQRDVRIPLVLQARFSVGRRPSSLASDL